jgi:hypothetical protein
MTDEKPAPGVPDADPTELIEGAISARAAAEQLRGAVRTAAREGRTVGVTTPDGRTVIGGEDILLEAAQLDGAAELDAVIAAALLLQDVCVRLDELRRQAEPPPERPIFSTMVDGPFVVPREMLGRTLEDAPERPCTIKGYHPNHLWWGPPEVVPGPVGAASLQPRYFCNGVRWQRPQPDPEARADARNAGDPG